MKSQPSLALPVLACVFFSITVFAADPGDVFPDTSALNDQKAGSVLFYNVYTSSTANPGAQNTILNMTNTSSTSAAFVHLFWIASSCAPADRFICLTAQQTITMDAFQLDPGVTGRLIAVAVDGVNGCPVIFNHLIGDEYVKFADGFFGSLNAEALAALTTQTVPRCTPLSELALLMFGLKSGFPGLEYNAIPKVIATSSLGSVADGYSHRIFINSINGDLRFGTGGSGNIFGLLFDESEQSYSFSFGAGCQFTAVLGSSFPRTTPRFQEIIPANSTGWMKIWSTAVGTFGVLFTRNPDTSTNPNAYNGARNFHKLTLGGDSFVIPVFPPTC